MIDTRKQFQLQTGVFLKRPDVVTFDESYKHNNIVDIHKIASTNTLVNALDSKPIKYSECRTHSLYLSPELYCYMLNGRTEKPCMDPEKCSGRVLHIFAIVKPIPEWVRQSFAMQNPYSGKSRGSGPPVPTFGPAHGNT